LTARADQETNATLKSKEAPGPGADVELTLNEVQHARTYIPTDLVVMSKIA
jgi:hypothetical protein